MNPIDIVPREEAVVSRLVEKLWTRRDPVTGLAGHLVILPSLRGVRQMRYLLMDKVRKEGGRGMLLPVGLNLWQIVEKVPSGSGLVPLSDVARVVRLAEWLQGQQERTVLFSTLEGTHPVRMAQFLLDAFDDLLRYSPLLDGKGFSFDSWSKEGAIESLVHLLDESVQQVISLLTDYVESLHLEGVDDPVHRRESEARRVARGDQLPHFIRRYEGVWVAGFDDATEGERCVLSALSSQPNCHVMASAGSLNLLSPETGGVKSSVAYYRSKHPDYSASRLLKTFGYGGEPPLETSPLVDMLFPRINRTAGKKRTLLRNPDTCERAKEILKGWLPGSVVECEDPFHEAMWVAKRVRQHMEEGKTVLVVTGEWHLASLVKQMLSFWNMDAESTFGSPLSQSWLFAMLSQVTEVKATGEHYRSLASLMRNPLFGVSSLSGQEGAHQLEREVAPNQGVASGLKSLIEACTARQNQLRADSVARGNPLDVSYAELVSALEGIRDGLAPLNALGAEEHSVATWAKEGWTLLETLTGVGLLDGFERPEENRFVSILQSLCGPDGDGELRTTWSVFLELVNGFVGGVRVQPPRNRETPVMIADPTQARFLERDQTLFCGLVDDWFPGMEPTNPLIPNDARTYMGMISSGYWEGLRASYFATLLSRPQEVQFSYHRQQGGTPMLRSRFLERLLGAAEELELPVEHFLQRTVFEYHWPDSEKSIDVESLKMTAHAWAKAPRELLPKRLSATATQRILECPYSWYCERILKLRPEEEVEEILTARDYGTEVHRILRAFHENEDRSDIAGLPGPFTGDLCRDREGAVKLMEEIGDAVFGELEMPDLGTHNLFEQFRGLIPTIVDAEIRRADEGWTPAHLESEFSWTPPGQSIAFSSKIDRLDVAEDGGVAVLDYKTGSTPPTKMINEGLRPQLFIGGLGVAHSQKLSGTVSQMSYYGLKPDSTKSQGIGTEDLTGKRGATKCKTMLALLAPYQELLERLVVELTAGQMTDLPAIPGDACKYCPYDGICRKDEVSK